MEIFSNLFVMDFKDIMDFNLCDVYTYIYNIYIVQRYRDVTKPKLRLSNNIAA